MNDKNIPETKEEFKEFVLNFFKSKENIVVSNKDYHFRRKDRDFFQNCLQAIEELHSEGTLIYVEGRGYEDRLYFNNDEEPLDFTFKEYFYYQKYFEIKFEKGIFTFTNLEGNIATYDINKNISIIDGKEKNSLVSFFRGYCVNKCSWHYYDSRKDITKDFFQCGQLVYDFFRKDFYNFIDHNYSNVGNMLPYFKKFENYHNWKKEGLNLSRFLPTVSPGILPKSYRKVFKEKNIELTRDIFHHIQYNNEILKQLLDLLGEERIPVLNEDRYRDNNWEEIIENENIYHLIKNENYEPKSLIRYLFNYLIPYEKLNIDSALSLLKDYANMHKLMEVKDFKRYPKYLKSKHDIVTGEFSLYKKEYDAELFKKQVKDWLYYKKAVEDKEGKEKIKFLVETPSSPEDLKREGKILSHCVGSYIDRVSRGETQIVFLRTQPNIPLVTVEIRDDVIIQAKGYENRHITKEEQKMLQEYAKEKNLLVRV